MSDFFYHALQAIVIVALFIAVVMSLSGCATPQQQRDAESWADTSHALGCVMGGLC